MLIGFFADDGSARLAASLADSVFNRRRPHVIQFGRRAADAACADLEEARARGGVTSVVMPLSELNHPAIRSRLDLAVVTTGSTPVYRAIAWRAVEDDARNPSPAIAPAWLCGETDVDVAGRVRRLPVHLGALSRRDRADLRAGCSCGRLHRRAVGLAAALRIAAEDPFADRIDPTEVADLIEPDDRYVPSPSVSPMLREELLDLAADLSEGARRLACGERRRRKPAAGKRIVRRDIHRKAYLSSSHEPGCLRASGQ